MKRLVTTGLLAVAALVGGFSVAFAQASQAVERSGNVYHAAVCPPGGPPASHAVTPASSPTSKAVR
jgi:hypothetical protein